MQLDRIMRSSVGERIKQRRNASVLYYVCKTKFDAAAGGGFDEIEDFYKSSQRDNEQQN